MLKRSINWKKLLGPTDSVALVVIIVGLLIAIFIDELAIRLIGVSVAVLGGVALAMLISQRMADIVDDRYKPSQPPPNYKITVKKESGAKRQTFEDFEKHTVEEENDFQPADAERKVEDDIKIITKKFDKEKKKKFDTDDGEGFRIIDKRAASKPDIKPEQKAPAINEQDKKSSVSIDLEAGYEFDDGESGVKVIGKVSKKQPQKTSKIIVVGGEEKKEKTLPDKEKSYDKDTLFEGVEEKEDKLIPDIDKEEVKEKEEVPSAKEQVIEQKKKQLSPEDIVEPEPAAETATAGTETKEEAKEKTKPEPSFNKKKVDIPLSTIIETETFAGQEPRKEFEYFLKGVLKVIRSITNTRTAAFLLVNNEKRELIIQAYDSQSPEAITPKQKLPIRNDIISQIATNLKPELLTEINPSVELDLIPYYTKPVGTGSFVGVPVFYNKILIGILCADSQAPDAYEAFTVGFLGNFTKLIGTLVNTYTEKYELLQASKTLNAIDSFGNFLSTPDIELDDIYRFVLDGACKVFDYTTIGVCGYNQVDENWHIAAIRSKNEADSALIGKEVKKKTTYLGESIIKKKTVFMSPMLGRGMMYHPKETKYPGGFFLSVPLKSSRDIYGAIFVVGRSQSNITNYDVKILEILASNAGNSIEHFVYMKMLKHNTMVQSGGILNETAFIARLTEEMNKAKELNNIVTLCLFSVDITKIISPELYPERLSKANKHVIEIFKKYLKSYHPIGKVDENKYSIILTGMKAAEAQRWAEKIRQDIARSSIEFENKRYYVTVSIGVSQAMKGETMNDLAINTDKALEMSLAKSNKVTVYE
jgi:diguanylate cyclase (GGDEF)-like protein